jgi:hypothetical protein
MTNRILKATHGSDKTPLKIGEIEIPAYVLEDGTAVLSGRAVQTALGFPNFQPLKTIHILIPL